MAPITYNYEIAVAVPPARLWKASIIDDNLICKVLPQAIKSVENIEGDGGVGSIKLVTFGEGSQYKIAKHRVDGLDEKTFTFSYTIIESDALKDNIEKISYVLTYEASADGGSLCKTTSTLYTKGDHVKIPEEELKAGKGKTEILFRAIEAYLLANPDAYN